MQARLTYLPFPLTLAALFFVIAAALLLGGILGYELKPVTRNVSTIVVERPGPVAPTTPACVWVDTRKGC